jgi:hypothetical protein
MNRVEEDEQIKTLADFGFLFPFVLGGISSRCAVGRRVEHDRVASLGLG